MSNTIYNEKLFSYGTLRYERVQLSTFGRILDGNEDILNGYTLSELQISDPNVVATSGDAVHPILISTGKISDKVAGMVFDISHEELMLADQYEVAEYKRISVKLASGIDAWVYVSVSHA